VPRHILTPPEPGIGQNVVKTPVKPLQALHGSLPRPSRRRGTLPRLLVTRLERPPDDFFRCLDSHIMSGDTLYLSETVPNVFVVYARRMWNDVELEGRKERFGGGWAEPD
jgi:hypothetical protein